MKRIISALTGVLAVLLVTAAMASAATQVQCSNMLTGNSVTWAPDNDIYRKGVALASTYGKNWSNWSYVNPGWIYTAIWIGRGEILEGAVRFNMTDGTIYYRYFWCVGTTASQAGDGDDSIGAQTDQRVHQTTQQAGHEQDDDEHKAVGLKPRVSRRDAVR